MGLSRVRFLVWPIPFSYRGRPLSPVGLDEGRLGMLQESMRELNVYQNDEDATGGDLSTRPTMRVSESTSTSSSEVENDGENEDDQGEGDQGCRCRRGA